MTRCRLFILLCTLALSVTFTPAFAQHAHQPGAGKQPDRPWMNTSLSPDERADLVLKQLTLDEKIDLLHGNGMPGWPGGQWPNYYLGNGGAGFVLGVPRLGIPIIQMSDAAYGVRASAENGRYSTALPSALASASSWDPQAACEYGALIGRELRAQGYNMTLGGGTNITREPRNGRTFEYLGEDPILAGNPGWQPHQVRAGPVRDRRHQALCRQRSGERTQRSQRHYRQARPARNRPAGFRNRHLHRPPRRGDVFLQRGQWRLRLREQVSADRCTEAGAGNFPASWFPTGAVPTAR